MDKEIIYKLRNESRKIENIVNGIDDKTDPGDLSDIMNTVACIIDEMSSEILKYEVEVE